MGLINQLNAIGGGGTTIIRRGYAGAVKDMEAYGSPSEAGVPNHELLNGAFNYTYDIQIIRDMESQQSPSAAGVPNYELSGTTWFMPNVSLNTSVTINVSTKDTNAKNYEANSTTWTLT